VTQFLRPFIIYSKQYLILHACLRINIMKIVPMVLNIYNMYKCT